MSRRKLRTAKQRKVAKGAIRARCYSCGVVTFQEPLRAKFCQAWTVGWQCADCSYVYVLYYMNTTLRKMRRELHGHLMRKEWAKYLLKEPVYRETLVSYNRRMEVEIDPLYLRNAQYMELATHY